MIFAQLTDLHACGPGTLAYGRVDTLPFVMRAVARLNALRPRIEAVVISGDLAERGAPAEYAALRPVLNRLEMPWWPIPGNHDGAAFAPAPPLAILCGHVHRTIHGTLSGVPAIVAPSPAHAVAFDLSPDGPSEFRMEPPGVLVHATGSGGLVSHTVFVDEHERPYPFFP